MFTKLKKAFTNRPWKEMKTRKITLVGVILFWITYTTICVTLSAFGIGISDSLTDNVFQAGEWLITTGTVITVAKIVKGRTNSDDDEIDE